MRHRLAILLAALTAALGLGLGSATVAHAGLSGCSAYWYKASNGAWYGKADCTLNSAGGKQQKRAYLVCWTAFGDTTKYGPWTSGAFNPSTTTPGCIGSPLIVGYQLR